MRSSILILAALGVAGWAALPVLSAADAPKAGRKPAGSAAEKLLEKSAAEGKFTFLTFYKVESPALKDISKVAQEGIARRSDKAVWTLVRATEPAEQALVEKFDVARSPLPLTIAVAPTMAVTGVFPKELKDEYIDAAIVTPTMTRCMKALQEGKLVFVCVQAADKGAVPAVVKQLQLDPDFRGRVTTVKMSLSDPAEERFLEQMQIDPEETLGTLAALLAPPGILIGKYDADAQLDDVVTALNEAGKCCDDPNCKHHQGAAKQKPAAGKSK